MNESAGGETEETTQAPLLTTFDGMCNIEYCKRK
jgi:hypothetical protein